MRGGRYEGNRAALKTAALHLNLVALRPLALTRTLLVRGNQPKLLF